MRSNRTRLLAAALALTALSAAPTRASGPTIVPMFEQFNDFNACTGNIVTYTFTGTAHIEEHNGVYVLTARGTAVTSDGYYGTFNRTFVFKGDQVAHLRFHDQEVSSTDGRRQVFSLGMYHSTAPDGTEVVGFEKYGGGGCQGN
jgi:hypothetical protein